jgi:transcriptional regulator with XRE-family HTH domain
VTPEERKTAEAIKSLRAQLNESQQEFSNRLGVVVRTVARWEREQSPRGDMLLKLADVASQVARQDLVATFHRAYSREIVNNIQKWYGKTGHPEFATVVALQWLLFMGDDDFKRRLRLMLATQLERLAKDERYPLLRHERKIFRELCKELGEIPPKGSRKWPPGNPSKEEQTKEAK